MKLQKIYDGALKENYIEIHYHEIDEELKQILSFLEPAGMLLGKTQGQAKPIKPEDIFYCEIVDKRCYAYLESQVWGIDISLSDFLTQYEHKGFVRISKSMLVNLHHIDRLEADINMRTKLILDNKESVIMNRSYRNDFFAKLKHLYNRKVGQTKE